MRVLAALAAACAVALLGQAPEIPGNAGKQLFERECSTCHIAGDNSRVPSLQALRGLEPDAVVAALTNGKMTAQAQRLSPADRVAVAEFVTARTVATASATSPGQCAAAEDFAASFGKPGWNGWGAGLSNARYTETGGISAPPALEAGLGIRIPARSGCPHATHGHRRLVVHC